MKKVDVFYEGWGERWLLGTVADNGSQLLFEYSPEALRQGLELSPRHLKLRAQTYGDFPTHQHRLPGLIADALPDGWGLLLMDRLFRQTGRNPAALSPLDRLTFLDGRTMGALTFEPSDHAQLTQEHVQLSDLARQSQQVFLEEAPVDLRKLALLGGSPHGARPKVLVHFEATSGRMYAQPAPGTQPWLVKFPAQSEHKEVCAIEMLYSQLARSCGLAMPETRYFDLDSKLAAFGVARFDVEDGMRVPVHTLAGFLHADFRIPSVDYGTFLRATRLLTRSEMEVKKAYERAVFNILFHNRDDHSKNFSFRLDRQRHWKLAPCYDLTFCDGPGGEHQMDVGGKGRNLTRSDLAGLAEHNGIDAQWAAQAVDRMLPVAEMVASGDIAFAPVIRKLTLKRIQDSIRTNARLLS